MELEDRQYQFDCIDELYKSFFNNDKSLVVLPTSAGKTHIFCELIKKCIEAKSDIKILVLINNVKLVKQNRAEAEKRGIKNCSFYCASLNEKRIAQVTFASIQSIKDDPAFFNLIINDEAHNLTPAVINFYDECKQLNDKLKWCGFTATAFNKEGYIYGPKLFYKKVTFTLPLHDLISMGYICDYVLFDRKDKFNLSKIKKRGDDYVLKDLLKLANDDAKARKQVFDIFHRTTGRKKIAIMCVGIDHAEKVKALIEEYEECAIIHSNLHSSILQYNYDKFENGDCRFVISVTMISEGYSFNEIDAIAILRPTRSARLMVQIVGRGLRLFSGKENCLILDYGDVFLNCGTPRDPIVWGAKGNKKNILSEFKSCPDCLMYLPKTEIDCSNCGYSFQRDIDREKNLNLVPLLDLNKVDKNQFSVTHMKVNFTYQAKSGNRICTKITYFTPRGQKYKWLFRTDEIKYFKVISAMGKRKPKFIKITKNEKNPKYPMIEEVWS